MHTLSSRRRGGQAQTQTISHGGVDEHSVSTQHAEMNSLASGRDEAFGEMSPLVQFVFAGEPTAALSGRARWPVTLLRDERGGRSASTQAIGVSGAAVRDIEQDGRVVARAYADDDAEYCYLGGVLPANVQRSRDEQAKSCFEQMETVLAEAGMSFCHIVRTWLYLDDLLTWYDDFNAVRTGFFRERGVFNHLVPASTGIGASNPWGAALVTGAIAIKPKNNRTRIFSVQSPLQCPAFDYRSSFSRAVEIDRPGVRQLFISGTASIAADGTSVHVGDIERQIELTMKVVHAILRSRRMDWSDATRMIAYFRNPQDIQRFTSWCDRNEVRDLPMVSTAATVCRDELLFEMEMDAATRS